MVSIVRAVGAVVRMELQDDGRRMIQVEMGREPYERIRAIVGEQVYVRPKRMRVFAN